MIWVIAKSQILTQDSSPIPIGGRGAAGLGSRKYLDRPNTIARHRYRDPRYPPCVLLRWGATPKSRSQPLAISVPKLCYWYWTTSLL